jgi:tetratricopeptide (TPR) repeat protein
MRGCTALIESNAVLPKARAIAFNNRGSLHFHRGDFGRAIADYDEAIKLDAGNASFVLNRCMATLRFGDAENSLASCDEATRRNPDKPLAVFNRAIAYYRKGDNSRALCRLQPGD